LGIKGGETEEQLVGNDHSITKKTKRKNNDVKKITKAE